MEGLFCTVLLLVQGSFAQFTGFGNTNFGFQPMGSPSSPASSSSGSPSSTGASPSPFGTSFPNFGSGGGFQPMASFGSPFSAAPVASPSSVVPTLTGSMGVKSVDSGKRAQSGGATTIQAGITHGTQEDTKVNGDGSQVTNTRIQPTRFTLGGSTMPNQSGGSGNQGRVSPSPVAVAPLSSGGSPSQDRTSNRGGSRASPSAPPVTPTNQAAAVPSFSGAGSPGSFGGLSLHPFGDSGNPFASMNSGGGSTPGANNMFGGNGFGGFGGFGNNNNQGGSGAPVSSSITATATTPLSNGASRELSVGGLRDIQSTTVSNKATDIPSRDSTATTKDWTWRRPTRDATTSTRGISRQ
ncbi:hypothetical protein BV898_00134 [Hypsibius exemplaris]|uniref:Uncharacterized protein n=1 Tax=Hypsibius exemplaris TaxID=2072580 RepID=A0A1W0XET5_HYPEX|nr:hypothetical protein BV898_00134 [Hypsibius exemplaris]